MRKGYAQALVMEACRRLKDELVTLAEAHALESNMPVLKLLRNVRLHPRRYGSRLRQDGVLIRVRLVVRS